MNSRLLQEHLRDRQQTRFFRSSASFTRAANLSTYAAGDVIGAAGSKGSILITSFTVANPGVFTKAAHGLVNGDAVQITATAVCTGLTEFVKYFVVEKTDNTFQLAATAGGTGIETTGAGTGDHTVHHLGPAVLTFSGIGLPDDATRILQSTLEIDHTAVFTSMTGVRLQLYSRTPPSALLDNDPWVLPAGDRASYMGYIDLGTPVDVGSTVFVQATSLNTVIVPPSDTIYAYAVTIAGCTAPAVSTVQKITLLAEAV
jgi:hypothetical protein